MSDLDVLKNKGILALNRSDPPSVEKTIIVLGAARGGTSMVAAVLQALGVHMGEKLGPVLEDVALSEAVEARDMVRLEEIVARRNAEHAVWGWKRPSAVEYAEVWWERFRNPHLIAVFRDPFAIANRNRISMLSDVFQNMEHSVQHLGAMVRLLRRHTGPMLLCSYEKALVYPETFVDAVAEFVGISDAGRRADALHCIDLEPRRYLETSRITHAKGYLGTATQQGCSGWAFYPKLPGRVARVRILLNGHLVDTVEARLPRPDLKAKGLHPTGLCGFRLTWPDGVTPRADDRVEAWVEGDVAALPGSPRRI